MVCSQKDEDGESALMSHKKTIYSPPGPKPPTLGTIVVMVMVVMVKSSALIRFHQQSNLHANLPLHYKKFRSPLLRNYSGLAGERERCPAG